MIYQSNDWLSIIKIIQLNQERGKKIELREKKKKKKGDKRKIG